MCVHASGVWKRAPDPLELWYLWTAAQTKWTRILWGKRQVLLPFPDWLEVLSHSLPGCNLFQVVTVLGLSSVFCKGPLKHSSKSSVLILWEKFPKSMGSCSVLMNYNLLGYLQKPLPSKMVNQSPPMTKGKISFLRALAHLINTGLGIILRKCALWVMATGQGAHLGW